MSRIRFALVALAFFAALPLAAADPAVDTTELQALLTAPPAQVVPVEEVPIEAILETFAQEQQAPTPAAGDCWVSNSRWVYEGCCISTTKYRLQQYTCCCCYATAPTTRCSWLNTTTTKCEGPCRQ